MNNYNDRSDNQTFGRSDNNTSSKYGSTNSGFDGNSYQQQQNYNGGFGSSANLNDRNSNERNRHGNCECYNLD